MRILLVTLLLAAAAGTAAAEPASTRCYAGTQHETLLGTAKDEHISVRRTLDPAKSELHETVWHDDRADATGKDMVAAIDAKAGTFSFELDGVKGSGTLTGPAWHWTGQTITFTVKGVDLAITSKLDGEHAHLSGGGTKNGKSIVTLSADLDVIDCSKMPAK